MGRKLKFGEPTKTWTIRIPESKYEEFRKMALEYLKKYISKIEVIINKNPSDNNCYNCGNNRDGSYGDSCSKTTHRFETCNLTGNIVDKSTKTILKHDDGREETIRTEDYIGNKGCNKWKKEEGLPNEKEDIKDCYSILGVSRNSSEQEIKIAYKQLAKKYHPDYNKNSNAQERFIELNNAYTELTKQEPPSIMDLMKGIFGDDFFGWSVDQEDFIDKGEISKTTTGVEEYMERFFNSEEYNLYSWASNKMGLLQSLNFKCYLNLKGDLLSSYFEEERELKPIVLKGIKDVIKHFQRVLNNEVDIKERITKPVNPIKDKNKRTYIPFYQKLLYNLRNQYHPKFINKFPIKYQSFIYEKIREMIIRLEKEVEHF